MGKWRALGGDCSEGLASVNHGSYTTREVRGMNWRSPRAGYGHMLFPTAADESELNGTDRINGLNNIRRYCVHSALQLMLCELQLRG